MNFADPSTALLVAAGGHAVKLFDASVVPGDPCTLRYTPSPGFQLNSVKWKHTNLVVASARDDKKISLWRKNEESMGTIPMAGTDTIDNIEAILEEVVRRRKPITRKVPITEWKRTNTLGEA